MLSYDKPSGCGNGMGNVGRHHSGSSGPTSLFKEGHPRAHGNEQPKVLLHNLANGKFLV